MWHIFRKSSYWWRQRFDVVVDFLNNVGLSSDCEISLLAAVCTHTPYFFFFLVTMLTSGSRGVHNPFKL